MTPTPEERAGGIKPYWHNDQRTWEDVLVDVATAIHDAEHAAFERGAREMRGLAVITARKWPTGQTIAEAICSLKVTF